MHIFRLFATSNLLGYISELWGQYVWKRCHNLCFGSFHDATLHKAYFP